MVKDFASLYFYIYPKNVFIEIEKIDFTMRRLIFSEFWHPDWFYAILNAERRLA